MSTAPTMSHNLPPQRLAEDKSAATSAEDLLAVARFLYDLLDDIDTTDDIAKENDAWYRKRVRYHLKRRLEVVKRCDGHNPVEFAVIKAP